MEGHYSSALCHLGNISYRLGSEAPFDAQAKAFGDDKDAYESLARMQEHLTQGNGLKLEGEKFHVGKKLEFDPQTEKFIGNADADALLTRNYRAEFEVPNSIA